MLAACPRLEPELRLDRLPDLDLARVKLSLSEAAEKTGFDAQPVWSGGRITLPMVMDRPAYFFTGGPTVFADTGEVMEPINENQARTVASRFMRLPEDKMHYVPTLSEPDQRTPGQGRQLPQYKYVVDDSDDTELYIQPRTGEVSMHTTHESRLLAWIGVIRYWIYFEQLHVNQPLLYGIVVWTSTIATVLALIGLIIGVIKFRWPKPFRWSAAIPYAG